MLPLSSHLFDFRSFEHFLTFPPPTAPILISPRGSQPRAPRTGLPGRPRRRGARRRGRPGRPVRGALGWLPRGDINMGAVGGGKVRKCSKLLKSNKWDDNGSISLLLKD